MKFKLPELKEQFWRIRSKARKIACDLDYYCISNFGREIVITGIFRPYDPENPKSPHPWGRAFDVRTHDPNTKEAIFSEEQRNQILADFNVMYDYGDGEHQTIIYHETFDSEGNSNGLHFHIQTREDGRV